VKEILIIDYGMGNIGSMCNALKYLGTEPVVSNTIRHIDRADAYILPGVGAFAAAMINLNKLNIIRPLYNNVIKIKKPFLGVCLGMQLLAKDSLEKGFSEGLGWIDGHVLPVEPKNGLRVPQVGWNTVKVHKESFLFKNIDASAHFYFDHSYHLSCHESCVVATCTYGDEYVAVVNKDNIFATQFHPEKSQRNGLKVLRNFFNFVQSC